MRILNDNNLKKLVSPYIDKYGMVEISITGLNIIVNRQKHSADYMGADGEVSLTDLHKMLIDEVGIKIDFDKERMR